MEWERHYLQGIIWKCNGNVLIYELFFLLEYKNSGTRFIFFQSILFIKFENTS